MAKKRANKHVYRVTFYYQSTCEVLVPSDEVLTRDDAVDKAYSQLGLKQSKQQVIDKLELVDTPDFKEEDANTFAFDKNGKIIHLHDKVVFHVAKHDYWNYGMVKSIATTPKTATITIATGSECVNVNASDCIVYE